MQARIRPPAQHCLAVGNPGRRVCPTLQRSKPDVRVPWLCQAIKISFQSFVAGESLHVNSGAIELTLLGRQSSAENISGKIHTFTPPNSHVWPNEQISDGTQTRSGNRGGPEKD